MFYFYPIEPFSVTALRASPNMDNVTLSWAQPVEYKSSYTYNLILENSNIIQKRANTSSENYTFMQLSPGTSYTFHVTTQTSDGTQGDPTKTSSCTSMVCFYKHNLARRNLALHMTDQFYIIEMQHLVPQSLTLSLLSLAIYCRCKSSAKLKMLLSK